MSKKRIITVAALLALITVLMAFAVSAESGGTWVPLEGGNWSYLDADGELVTNEVGYYIDGSYYGFDAYGIMYKGWVQPNTHRLQSDREYRFRWYFFDESGRARSGYDAETGYLFNYDGGVNANGYTTYWDEEGKHIFVSDAEGRATELIGERWLQANGNWYYVDASDGDRELYTYSIYNIDGVEYYFYNGRLGGNTFHDFWNDDNQYVSAYIDGDGHPIYEGWILHDGNYYYIGDGEVYEGGIYRIGDNQYYFDYSGRMVANGWIYGTHYASASGALLKNQWHQAENGEWMYFDATGEKVSGGFYTIGDVKYFFDGNGYMAADRAERVYEYVQNYGYRYVWYYCAANGAATPVADGWLHTGDGWMYFEEGMPYGDTVENINGVEYAFDGYYLYDEETVAWAYDARQDEYAYVHVNADGTVNRTPGWKLLDGRWILVDGSGCAKNGWVYDGRWYYLNPYVVENDFYVIGGRTYYFDADGNYTEIYQNGFQTLASGATYYFEYGTPAYGWRQMNGNWYYFGSAMATDTTQYIGSDRYYFDQNGIMQTGWFRDKNGEWRYADENGHLVNGLVTLGDVTYAFNENGVLRTNSSIYLDGVRYLTDENGVAFATSNDASGWISYNGKWYYLNEDGYFYSTGTYYVGENLYYFSNYVMQEDVIMDGNYFGVGGSRYEDGWFMKDGKWYYANEYGSLSWDVTYIDGQYYYFDSDYSLVIGTFIYGAEIATTDASGHIIAAQPYAEGWNLISAKGYGAWYYVQDGELYDGWVGNYYVSSYRGMYRNGVYSIYDENTDGGTYYYFDENGNCLLGGWVFDGEYWLYAQAGGKLVCNDWLLLDGTYYYFDGTGALEDGVYEIDGKMHRFAKGGAWLGEDTATRDGWQLIDGKWHYFENGEEYQYGLYCIDGTWYGFGYNGLESNDFVNNYYVNASGVMVPYTGWQQIGGAWYYFTVEHTAAMGWFTVDGVQYYSDYNGMATGYSSAYNYSHADDVLYQFSESGAFIGVVTEDGWYAGNGVWYYVRNGKLLQNGVYNIDGVNYAFDYEGEMIVNDIWSDYYYEGGSYLFLGNGAQAGPGWYLIYGTWLYVDANGYLCTGTHVIDGVTYNFDFVSTYYYY